MKIKQLMTATLSALMLFNLFGCNSSKKEEADPHPTGEIRDITAKELVSEIKIGWNLGNTFDATGNKTVACETAWGNPVTTKEMIDSVKEQGFNLVRVPVTWQDHIGEGPDYIIDEEWLNRVQEVVDYVIEDDMFCIINVHHEDWHFPSYDNLDSAKGELTAIWTQIANRFEGYTEKLIFEGMNEPRKKGTPMEWTGGDAESWDCINQLNAAFVDTIRSASGNNPKRCLMIPTYAASLSVNVCNNFIVPDDDKVIVSAHSYSPYNFALNTKGTDQFDPATDSSETENAMRLISEYFLSRNIPVIIGEFGAVSKNNDEERTEWAGWYVSLAKSYGIPCVWWDNGAFSGGGENFGLYQRRNNIWLHTDIVDAIMKAVNS